MDIKFNHTAFAKARANHIMRQFEEAIATSKITPDVLLALSVNEQFKAKFKLRQELDLSDKQFEELCSYEEGKGYKYSHCQGLFITDEAVQIIWEVYNEYGEIDMLERIRNPDWNGTRCRRTFVSEHMIPTSVMRKSLFGFKPDNRVNPYTAYAKAFLERNVVAFISARQDKLLDNSGLRSVTPNVDDLMARYTKVGIETFPLREEIASCAGQLCGDGLKIFKKDIIKTCKNFSEYRNVLILN